MTASGSGGTYTWFDDPTMTNPIGTGTTQNPYTTVGTTTYYVDETSVAGCVGPASTVTITIEPCDIIIPTAITPDNDMMNDDWEIVNLDNAYPDNNVFIYNRWGNIIFEHFSATDGTYDANRWDGTFNGEMLPVGSYYFIIEFNNEADESATGTVSIILQD